MHRERFLELGSSIDAARRSKEMAEWAAIVASDLDPVEAASQLAEGVEAHASLDTPTARAVLAAAIASLGIPCVVEGRSYESCDIIDEIDVLVEDRGRWIPVGPRAASIVPAYAPPPIPREPTSVLRLEIR